VNISMKKSARAAATPAPRSIRSSQLPKPFYVDELVTLYHADIRVIAGALDAAHGPPAALITDPPYGIAYCPREAYGASWAGASIVGDESADLMAWIAAQWPTTPLAMFGSYKVAPPFRPNATLVWEKGLNSGMGDLSMPWKPNWELVWVRGRTWRGKRTSGVLRGEVSSFEKRGRRHPTEKPVEVLRELVRKAPPGTLLDPCCGSGGLLEAARLEGRRAVGVEIDLRWCEATKRRLAATPL
jgi:hypothetical protein